MNSTLTEENANATTPAGGEQPKAGRKAARSPRSAPVAPKKRKAGKKATPYKKASKGAKKRKGAREGSKTARVLDLLRRKGGVTAKELLKATGWQPHSLRGFLSGTVGKKMRLTVTSTKSDDGERTYSIES